MYQNINNIKSAFMTAGYIMEDDLATTLMLMEHLNRPVLIEGEAGVGKTEIAKVLAQVNDCPLIRLQCYEGLDANTAVYEWNYSHQLLEIKLQENKKNREAVENDIFSKKFLLERPLLKAITQKKSPILLIDEIDRTDDAFEAFLLELLSDFQISIPELGTIKATTNPMVILTSNGTRELSDALRRRCLYHYLDYPDPEKELNIVQIKLPDIDQNLASQIVNFVQSLRNAEPRKCPGIAETLDWASALIGLNVSDLKNNHQLIYQTRSCLLKTQDDIASFDQRKIDSLCEALT